MKTSQLLIPTQKEAPSDAQIISHQLMIRAGLISRLASGLYTWLPLGFRIIKKIETIIRDEMNKSGAQELLMPMVQPAELWQKTGRLSEYGKELLRFTDRHEHDFCLAPTHEEVITYLASQYIKSYKQLPLNLYQIQTKFRDEIRPRFGVMRAREFIMKDAYSFHLEENSLQETYHIMYETYCRIFQRLGLNYRAVLADSGSIGGDNSHEFHILADAGEDEIVFSDTSDYAANIQYAKSLPKNSKKEAPKMDLTLVATVRQKTALEVANFLHLELAKVTKTLVVHGKKGGLVALVLRGDHELNEIKSDKIKSIASPLRMATNEEVFSELGCNFGSIGVVNLKMPIIVDYAAASLSDFVCGANIDDKHYTGVNWERDVAGFVCADLRKVCKGDDSPDGKGKLVIKRGIEVGHIFQLGKKYSDKLGARVMGKAGKAITLLMGCYGIGVGRLVAGAIEQHHDEAGIVFPVAIAPFEVIIVPINYHKSHRVAEKANALYKMFLTKNIEVLLDDRKERAGIMFADSELLGIPHRIVISDGLLDENKVEYQARRARRKITLPLDETVHFLREKISQEKMSPQHNQHP